MYIVLKLYELLSVVSASAQLAMLNHTNHTALDDSITTPMPRWAGDPCAHEHPGTFKVVLVVFVGTTISVISMIENGVLLFMWAGHAERRKSNYFYLIVLAVFDIIVAATYIPLFTVNVITEEIEWAVLSTLWYGSMVPMLTLGHIAITASTFMILLATIERSFIAVKAVRSMAYIRDHRKQLVAGAIALAVFSKAPILFEIETLRNGNCTGITAWKAQLTSLSLGWYGLLFRFWYRNVVTVMLPFVVCFVLQFQIVSVLRRQLKGAKLFRFSGTSRNKAHIRSATRMLVMIVLTYLLANVLDVIITVWEYLDTQSLYENFPMLYTYSSDIISLLRIVACALRLPIYLSCNEQVRDDMQHAFRRRRWWSDVTVPTAGRACAGAGSADGETGAYRGLAAITDVKQRGTIFDQVATAIVVNQSRPLPTTMHHHDNSDGHETPPNHHHDVLMHSGVANGTKV